MNEQPSHLVSRFCAGLFSNRRDLDRRDDFNRLLWGHWLMYRCILCFAVVSLLCLSQFIGLLPNIDVWIYLLSISVFISFPFLSATDRFSSGEVIVGAIVAVFACSLFAVLIGADFFFSIFLVVGMVGMVCMMVSRKFFVIMLWTGACVASIVALRQGPINGTHRWVNVAGWSFNASHLLAAATVLLVGSFRITAVRFVGLLVGIVLLVLSASYTFGAVVAFTSCLILLAEREWVQLWLIGTILGLSVLMPLAFSYNRTARVIEFTMAKKEPYQVKQARKCLRGIHFIGTSKAIRYPLPGFADDMSTVTFMVWGGACFVWLIIACHGIILMCLWQIGRTGTSVTVGVFSFYLVILLLHLLSNLTLVPTLGVSAPLQGSGLTNVTVTLIMIGYIALLPPQTRVVADVSNVRLRVLASALALLWVGVHVVVGTIPLWAPSVFGR